MYLSLSFFFWVFDCSDRMASLDKTSRIDMNRAEEKEKIYKSSVGNVLSYTFVYFGVPSYPSLGNSQIRTFFRINTLFQQIEQK